MAQKKTAQEKGWQILQETTSKQKSVNSQIINFLNFSKKSSTCSSTATNKLANTERRGTRDADTVSTMNGNWRAVLQ